MSSLPMDFFEPRGGFARDIRFAPFAVVETPEPPMDDPVSRAFTEGYVKGAEETLLQARAAATEEAAARGRIESAFDRLGEAETLRLEERLRETVLALCENAMAPMAVDPESLTGRIRKALALLRRAEDDRILKLHPDDLGLVAERLPDGLRSEPHPSLERGSLRVETAEGGVEDGPDQWRGTIAEALRLC